MKKPTYRQFVVTVPRLRGVSVRQWHEYLAESIGEYHRGVRFHAGLDPMRLDDIKVVGVGTENMTDPNTSVADLLSNGTTTTLELIGPWLEGEGDLAVGCQTYARVQLNGQRLISEVKLSRLIEAAREEGRQEVRTQILNDSKE